ncbi:cell division regulator GpsB [Enterococcus aquimarinus]|uniref:Cell cycle protein GpsB n=1 Tax=Enterococcus aquimarinus TaxID=328396 RepID=A0A1L8QXU5_9ENTE|nr:cell division regulator GpsB [Enterococcus aquimarinus]MBP9521126.1 cell division regulator GpsB [Enterococcus sp.]MBP9638890.1 cell division regulator GpsB [Enterococcus sp.]MCC9273794.1 cell division regulator GpsB [Enterococcus aquimarinus]OJG12322.1 cell division protein DivIVA [Enterococcus aquimarinus]
MTNLNYSPKDILQQEFKTKMRGYDPIEVDEFLDGIIKDYETYNKEILTLQEENDRLNAKIAQLSKSQAISSRIQATPEAPKSQAVTNFDILKRLSNLEKEVFGKKLDQPTPTNGFDSSLNRSAVHFSDDDDLEKTRQF